MSDSTGDLLLGAARSMRRRFVTALGEGEITPGQARALRVVCEHEPIRLSTLAEHLRIAPRSATEVVDALEATGLVRRAPDPADRRAVDVVSTPAGLERQRAIEAVRGEAAEGFLAALSEPDRATLDRILRQLADQ